MSVLGIVAEYDPFHNGHLHHLQEAVSAVSPAAVLVALSGVFKQRGEPALLSPFVRAEAALSAGADAVVSLPLLWTVRDAEHYALGSVSLLASLGVTHLAFGAETADLPLLRRTADLLEEDPPALRETLRASLSSGKGYPAALSEAAGACVPESGAVLKHPNNILAVCYLRAVRRLGLPMVPVVIPRSGSYHADAVSPSGPSASAVRGALRRGSWQEALQSLPPASARVVRAAFLSGEIPDPKRIDALLLDRLRSLSPANAARLPDCPEGLDAALLKAAAHAASREDLLAALTTRRYPSARISRLCACALLGITAERLAGAPLPSCALLLGIKKNPKLSGSWNREGSARVLSPSQWRASADPEDLAAFRLWGLCCGKGGDFPFTQKVISGSR